MADLDRHYGEKRADGLWIWYELQEWDKKERAVEDWEKCVVM
jgi:hypothetical protein